MTAQLNDDYLDRNYNKDSWFGCEKCRIHFMQRTRIIKPISRCKGCNTKLDEVTCNELFDIFGKGWFKCKNCNNSWTSESSKLKISQPCYKCQTQVYLHKIGDPTPNGKRKSNFVHKCSNCPNCNYYKGKELRKKHLLKLKKNIWSKEHKSSGSTISAGTNRSIQKIDIEFVTRLMSSIDLQDSDSDDDN